MKKIILALACCSVLGSCVKNIDKDVIDVSKTTYLMNGKWQLRAGTWLPDINDSASFPVDEYKTMSECVKDNYFKFNTSSDVSDVENMKCELSQPDVMDYKYALTSNDRYLKIWSNPDDPDNSVVLAGDVIYSSIDTFVISYNKPNPQNTDLTSRYVRTYVKFK